MKKLHLLALSLLLLTGCKSDKLQSGGSYAPTNSVGVATMAPDIAFFQVDSAFDLAYSTFDAAFKFEQDNRLFLWNISPSIKHSLDAIRPQAVSIVQGYGVARAAYAASPTPAGLDTLRTLLGKAQQLGSAAQAVVNQNLTQPHP